ncbi:hypothetical protein E4T39_01452 [Aureobasidium subglaciale]|nr:hypothetical protein E4T39_01452 [Aureobasidium subglaciale]
MAGRGGREMGRGSLRSRRADRTSSGRQDRGDRDNAVGTSLGNGSAGRSNVAQRGLGGICGIKRGASAGLLALLQKAMKRDVLYLLIADRPTDEELAAARGIVSDLLAGQKS